LLEYSELAEDLGGHDFSRAAMAFNFVFPSRPWARLRGEGERESASVEFFRKPFARPASQANLALRLINFLEIGTQKNIFGHSAQGSP
jgi:hypothetical protein